MTNLVIQPRDPLIFRDGKDFSAGLGATSLPFATPSAVVGALRTRLGTTDEAFVDHKIAELLKIEFEGPYLGYRDAFTDPKTPWELAFHAPADAVQFPKQSISRLVPMQAWRNNCDLPGDFLSPLAFQENPPEGKPESKPASFWTADEMAAWLGGAPPKSFEGIQPLQRQRRVQLAIKPESQTADDGMLFTTNSIEFLSNGGKIQYSLVNRFNASADDSQIPQLSHLGGEGRLAFWTQNAAVEWPSPPEIKTKGIRLILATPAVFDHGWRPQWINAQTGEGTPPGSAETLRLRLTAVALRRPQPLSGWDYKTRKPKPTRWLAPAGSVYFFEILNHDGNDISNLWLKSICDQPQDRLDGFGRVLTGVLQI